MVSKTVISLTAAQSLLYDSFDVSKVIVIAPLRVAEDTWSREAAKWDHLSGLRISKVLGSLKRREQAIRADADIYVTNRENVVWLQEYMNRNKDIPRFDMIIVDELSSFKSNQAKRFKALRVIRSYAKRIVGLTGTPAANSLMDLWAEIGILDGGDRLGRFISQYREAFFRPGWCSPSGIVYKFVPKPGAMQQITKRISDITISLKASDYLDLPDEIEDVIYVELPEDAAKQYRDMEREALITVGNDQITALNAAAVMTKLTQISNGFVYNDGHEPIRIHDAKTEALQEIIEAADSPVIVFYQYREDADHLLKTIQDSKLLRDEEDIKNWNEKKIPVLLVHPASAGYGLNLQQGGHIIVWYGLTWSLEQYLQANARLHRQGQDRSVLVYRILSKGTVDQQILESLDAKDATQNEVLEILKKRRQIV